MAQFLQDGLCFDFHLEIAYTHLQRYLGGEDVADICNAVRASRALKVYVCNLATQPGETDDYTAGDHVRALCGHLGPGFCDYVLVNANTDFQLPPQSGSTMVQPQCAETDGYRIVSEDMVDRELPWRHDSGKLAEALIRLYGARDVPS